jgi:hypothetical protein
VLGSLSRNFFEYHAKTRIVDFRCPTIRFCKCADCLLTRCTRCTFYIFGRPTRFKLALKNHAVFPLLDALSNKSGELVLRVRSVGCLFRHVLGGTIYSGAVRGIRKHKHVLLAQSRKRARSFVAHSLLCRTKTPLDCAEYAG